MCAYKGSTSENQTQKSFMEFHEELELKIQQGQIDESRLSLSLTQMLGELIEDQNQSSNIGESMRTEGDQKLDRIEIELDEIAQSVKKNLNSIFERGEKFGVLAQKSESLKSSVRSDIFIISYALQSRTLRTRASQGKLNSIRQQVLSYITYLVLLVRLYHPG